MFHFGFTEVRHCFILLTFQFLLNPRICKLKGFLPFTLQHKYRRPASSAAHADPPLILLSSRKVRFPDEKGHHVVGIYFDCAVAHCVEIGETSKYKVGAR